MPLYIKTEKFRKETLKMSLEDRNKYLKNHKLWVEKLTKEGINIFSGFLVNENRNPGDGGVLIFRAEDFKNAKLIIMQDPMIKNDLVDWKLNEYVPVSGTLYNILNGDIFQ